MAMVDDTFRLRPGKLTLGELKWLMKKPRAVEVDPAAWTAVEASAEVVRKIVAEGRVAYGVTPGCGSLAKTRIPSGEVGELQRRLVLSHAAGTGPLLED